MGTPNSTALEKTGLALLRSDIPEEKELGDRVAGAMEQIIASIKPMIRYLMTGGEHRVIASYEGASSLCVNSRGDFYTKDKNGAELAGSSPDSPWLAFPAHMVIEGLERLHLEVAEAREKRLADIKEAHSRLAKISEILNPTPPENMRIGQRG